MQQLVLLETPPPLAHPSTGSVVPAMDADDVVRDRPDAHFSFIDDDGQILGRCSLWWRNTPTSSRGRVGAIGHYAVNDRWAAQRVLQHACQELATKGCTMAVGPMDGNTWRHYRLVTEFGSEPTFFLEPNHPPNWSGHFAENGFKPLAEYFSALNDNVCYEDPLTSRVVEHLKGLDIRIRTLDPKHFDDELSRVYSVAKVSFRNNLLYTMIDEEEFIDLYRPLQHAVDPRVVFIAERHNKPVGFLFAIPDLLQGKRGQPMDTLIVKTLAILPGHEYVGLGYLLLDRVHCAACKLGYTRLIYALVRDGDCLRRRIVKIARPIRRYALFAKELRV